ncbi:MAG: DoxX family protein [Deltaproteobacteria bacterium]
MASSWRETSTTLGLLWLRGLTGLFMAIFHGYGKIFGGRMDKFTAGVAELGFPMPEVFAWAAALSEFLGGILIALGLGARISALLLFATMATAAFLQHGADPIDVKEKALLFLAMSGAIALLGPGKLSLDYAICRYWRKKP